MVKTEQITLKTTGNCQVLNITDRVAAFVATSGITEGTVTVLNVGSTAGITTTEYEPGLVNYDIAAAFEKIAPQNARYEHEETTKRHGTTITAIPTFGPRCSAPP